MLMMTLTTRTTTLTTMRIEAYAKVNLTLDVYGTRPDGYHALRSVVLPISLSDTLTLEPADGFSSDTGYDDDLCLKAARILGRGVDIRVEKRIPAGGGLGGGSADAAAVLRAINLMYDLGHSREELAEIGAQVGSDVPALVLGAPVLMEGRGEKVTRLSAPAAALHLVLVNPGIHSSTKEVYAACRARAKDAPSATDEMIAALQTGDFRRICVALANDLQEPAVRLHPEIADAMVSLKSAGAGAVLMSGSGSTVFGLVPDSESADRLARMMAFRGYAAWAVDSVCTN